MTRVLGALLLLAVGVGTLLLASRGGARAEAVEQRWRGRYANTDWTWHYRVFGVTALAGAMLVALGVLRFGALVAAEVSAVSVPGCSFEIQRPRRSRTGSMSSGNDQARTRARILRRVSAQQQQMYADVAAAERWGTDHPDQYAGTWFDNDGAEAGTGPVRIALGVVSGSDPEPIERLREQLRYPERLVVRECEHSLRELDELRSEFTARHMPQRQRPTGTYVTTISTDLQANAVHITLSTNDKEAAERLRQEFLGRPLKITLGVVVMPAAGRSH